MAVCGFTAAEKLAWFFLLLILFLVAQVEKTLHAAAEHPTSFFLLLLLLFLVARVEVKKGLKGGRKLSEERRPRDEAAKTDRGEAESENEDASGDDSSVEVNTKSDAHTRSSHSSFDSGTFDKELPESFLVLLNALLQVTETKDTAIILETTKTIRTLLNNAVTKGQENTEHAAKYRRIRLSNPRIQKCNIEGAFDLIIFLGFEIKENFDNEKMLGYPRGEEYIPDWLPQALEYLEIQIQALEQQQCANNQKEKNRDYATPEELKQRVRRAALERFHYNKRNRKIQKPKESTFTSGLGGGNRGAIWYSGGT